VRHGLEFALAAVDGFQSGWASASGRVCCVSPVCDAQWALSLRATAEHFLAAEARALLPGAAREAGLSPQQLAERKLPLHTLSPSLLGRFVELGRCRRYIHLRSDRGRTAGADEASLRSGVESALERVSFASALMAKGLAWEARLNALLTDKAHPEEAARCLRPLLGDDAPPLSRAPVFRDLAAEAFRAACNCSRHRLGRFTCALEEGGRELPHDSNCGFDEQLLRSSLDALLSCSAPAQGEVLILYQAKFKVTDYSHPRPGGAAVDSDVLSFSKYQTDYLVVTNNGGQRRVVVVDAKASARVKQSHRVQVAFYCSFIGRLMRAEALRRAQGDEFRALPSPGVVAPFGAVWRPPPAGSPVGPPDTFGTAELMGEVESLIFDELAGSLTRDKYQEAYMARRAGARTLCAGQNWRLAHSCAGCDFEEECRAEAGASSDLGLRLAGLTPSAAKALRGVCAGDVADIEGGGGELGALVQTFSLGNPRLAAWLRELPRDGRSERLLSSALKLRYDESGLRLAASAPAGAPARLSASPRLEAIQRDAAVVRYGALCASLPCRPAGDEPEWGVFITLLTEARSSRDLPADLTLARSHPEAPSTAGPSRTSSCRRLACRPRTATALWRLRPRTSQSSTPPLFTPAPASRPHRRCRQRPRVSLCCCRAPRSLPRWCGRCGDASSTWWGSVPAPTRWRVARGTPCWRCWQRRRRWRVRTACLRKRYCYWCSTAACSPASLRWAAPREPTCAKRRRCVQTCRTSARSCPPSRA
jgi:hypothetical protein